MITSTSNQKVKYIAMISEKAGKRRANQEFIVEGLKMFEEAPEHLIKEVYVSESFLKRNEPTEKMQRIGFETVSDQVFGKMTDTKTPQGILALLSWQKFTLEQMLKKENPLLIVLEDIQDPGNLGTILRTAEGAGAAGVIMSQNTVDIYNPKVTRSTMGSIFRVPHFYTEDLHNTIKELQKNGVKIYAAHLKATQNYDEISYKNGTAFLIGNEGNGLKNETAKLADEYILIPMQGQVESLNAAIATSILAFETARQRRN